ncbi:hypothetical protein CJ030_MR4G016073 [Morella rubra]|uniref:non-specific serine/threonine protein kinase n=1 Tax=Morella rubra TaxID=262757 RepID=A0A6A1VVC5_9ROSI|nr:hypothetical protein CJ030_MR4G016073 [Morella rubra]
MKIHNSYLGPFLSSVIYLHVILVSLISPLFLQRPSTAAATPTNETDRLALLKFKESISMDPYGTLSSWNDSIHFCNWYGITCSRRHQRVAALYLQNHNLHGTLSPYIGNLTFLRFINLRNNSFYGEIPQEVGRFLRLQHLNLSNNMLGGEIPVNLTNCSKLRALNLYGNKLIGKIPTELGSLTKLVLLRVEKNKLTGGIPSSLANLTSIVFLNAGENYLVGNIPGDIGRLKSLIAFSAYSNNLSGMVPSSLFNISSLSSVSFGYNQFSGTLPKTIGLTLPNLLEWGIPGNEFSGEIPVSFSNASQLEILDIGENNFVGQVPTNLGNLVDLRSLRLAQNYLGRDLDFVTSLTNCSKLRVLDFTSNEFGGVLPTSISNLSTQLIHLYSGVNEISGAIPAALESLHNLIGLGMDNNLFTGVIPSYIGKFQKMQALALAANQLTGKIPDSIGNLTRLVALFLSQNKLEGSIPPTIGDCQHLQKLDISQNNLSGVIPRQVFGLPSLSLLLNLSHNSLSGKLPVEVGTLKSISSLDVSENNLSGEIPETIGSCSSLEYLYVQGNSFEGSIPSSMASLRGLQHLDVSRNNFSGLIPEGLETLPFLKNLNLSFNNIEGEVPTEGVFRNPEMISVTGNNKLCGGVSQLRLPKCPSKEMKARKSQLAVKIASGIACVALFLLFSSCIVLYWRKKSRNKPSSMASRKDLLPTISYKMLHQATNGFSPSNLIGAGSFGSVYKGALDQEERAIAVKVLNLHKKGASKSFLAECNALRNIRHRNLVKIVTCCSSLNHEGIDFKALVFEFMANGSLDMWLHPVIDSENQSNTLSLLQRLNIVVDVASALDYLHNHCEQHIVHRDLKPSNVLLDNEMIAHVSDFGLARILSTVDNQKHSSTIGLNGTIGYAAPEYSMGGEASTKGDVYSFGILALEMFTGRRPTDEKFKDGLDLRKFAKLALPERLFQVVDPKLLQGEAEETDHATAATDQEDNGIVAAEGTSNPAENLIGKINANAQQCLLSVLNIGIVCSSQSPKERMSMEKVTKELHTIKEAFFGSRINRERPNRAQVRGALDPEERAFVAVKVLSLQKKGASKSFLAECNAIIFTTIVSDKFDLKPSSILDNEVIAPVSNFGLARILSSTKDRKHTSTSGLKGSIGYAAPVLLRWHNQKDLFRLLTEHFCQEKLKKLLQQQWQQVKKMTMRIKLKQRKKLTV